MDGPTGYALGRLRASAGSNIASVMAHESGHNLGLWHAPCGDPPNPDEDYPYIDASIGTYGYDILNSRVWAPGGPDYAKDFMSYCSPEWISDYNFRKLYEDQRQYGAVADQDPVQRTLLVRVTKRPGEEYELHPVYQLEAVPTTLPEASDLRIELLDNTGQILHSYPLQVVHTEEEEYQMEVAIAAIAIPQDAKVAQVRLRDKELVVADRTLSALTRRNASSEIAFEHSDEGLAIPSLAASKPVLLRFQATGNDNWTTYAVDFNEDEFFLPASSLPKIPGKLEIVMADSTGLGSSKHIDWAIR